MIIIQKGNQFFQNMIKELYKVKVEAEKRVNVKKVSSVEEKEEMEKKRKYSYYYIIFL